MSDEHGGQPYAASRTGAPVSLDLVGLHPDGEHLMLRGPGPTTYRLAVSDALRATLRSDRSVSAPANAEVSPREIQARVRAGETAEEIAAQSGLPLGQIRRYEGPVLAEREYIAQQARAARLGAASDAPTLGDLVTDRLAARHVEVHELAWDAARTATGQWNVSVKFQVGSDAKTALWSFEQSSHSVRALEDEARWLSETEIPDEPIPGRRHLAAVRDEPFDFDAQSPTTSSDTRTPAVTQMQGTTPSLGAVPEASLTDSLKSAVSEDLLDDLARRRGVRQRIEIPDEDDEQWSDDGALWSSAASHPTLPADVSHQPDTSVPGTTDAKVYSLTAARDDDTSAQTALPSVSSSHDDSTRTTSDDQDTPSSPVADPASDEADVAPSAPTASTKSRGTKRGGRSQMPSWDEIVFGAKPE